MNQFCTIIDRSCVFWVWSLVCYLLIMSSNALQANERHRLYRSGHFLGRGDTGIAVADNDEAIYYNPAGLAQGTGIYKKITLASPHLEFSKTTRDLTKQLAIEEKNQTEALKEQIGEPQHGALYQLSSVVLRRAAIGALGSAQANILVSKSADHGGLETVSADLTSNQVLSFSLAEGFLENNLLVGTTVKYIKRGTADFTANIIDAQKLGDLKGDEFYKTGSGIGVDLGLMWTSGESKRRTRYSFGLTVKDVGNTHISSDVSSKTMEPLKQTVNFGTAFTLSTVLSSFTILADYYDILASSEPNSLKNIHLGGELDVLGFVGLTAGLNQGYPAGGLYVDSYFARLDLGFYAEEMGDRIGSYADQRYFIKLSVGF